MRLSREELESMSSNINRENTDIYQLVVPVLLPSIFTKNYKRKLLEKEFLQENLNNDDILELLYLNVVQNTYLEAFEYHRKQLGKSNKFTINFTEMREEWNSNSKFEYLEFDLIKYQLIFNKFDLTEKEISTSMYIVLTLAYEKNEKQKNSIDFTNFLISSLSTLETTAIKNPIIQNSFITIDNTVIEFIHGSQIEIDKELKSDYAPRYEYLFDLFDIKDEKIRSIYHNKVNYPLGMNVYLNYYSVLSENTYRKFSRFLENPDDVRCNCSKPQGKHEDECHAKNKLYLPILNKLNTSKLINIYVEDVDAIIEKLICKNFMKSGTLYLTGERNYGVIVESGSYLTAEQQLSSYAPAIFFSLNHKILNISIQEQLKGIESNKYKNLIKYHLRIEKYVFYEITAESHLQNLYERMQIQHRNQKSFDLINNEIEIHQNRHLNNIFEQLTNVGIYIAIASLMVAIPSYLATYSGIEGVELTQFELLLADPLIFLIATITILVLAMISLEIILKKRR